MLRNDCTNVMHQNKTASEADSRTENKKRTIGNFSATVAIYMFTKIEEELPY